MKYRLLAPHVMPNQQLLEAGTEVGDGATHSWRYANGDPIPPSTQMEGLDDEARKEVKKLHHSLYGDDPLWDSADGADERKALNEQAEDQAKLERESEPVSPQQDAERKNTGRPHPRVAMPGAARQPSHTAMVTPTVGGDTAPARGPATPKPPKNPRPENPNEDQYPKG
jgi:hypothetical protein